jgi:hypothetical protein
MGLTALTNEEKRPQQREEKLLPQVFRAWRLSSSGGL